ncbi:MAG: rhomboid family protein [Caulobacter sp.]|nr:rhomboid family protein [Caulobacter sp.]
MDERHRELVKDEHGPWGPRDGGEQTAQGPLEPPIGAHPPAFNVPWPVLVLLALLGAAYAGQQLLSDARVETLLLTPQALDQGRWQVLLSYQFLHANLAHLGVNALSAAAFAAPVARYFGTGPRGGLIFFAFYIVCGVLAGLGFVAAHLHGQAGAVGASGAISALMGAAARLMDRPGRLSPIWTRSVYSLGGSFLVLNLLLAMTGFAPGMDGARIAWEAHIAGFVAGMVLIGVFGRLRRAPAETLLP